MRLKKSYMLTPQKYAVRVDELNQSMRRHPRPPYEGLITGISAGVFFLIIGVIFVTRPGLYDAVQNFFLDFGIVRIPNLDVVYLPAPRSPSAHTTVYLAVEHFSYVWGIFQIFISALRVAVRSPLGKKAESISNIVSSLGTGFLVQNLLVETTMWFPFWAAIIMLLGVSLIVRAIILATAR